MADIHEPGAPPETPAPPSSPASAEPRVQTSNADGEGEGLAAANEAVLVPPPPEPTNETEEEASEPVPPPPASAPRPSSPSPSRPEPTEIRRKHHVAPALILLERLDDDETFRFRDVGDVGALATDIARLGQLFPIDLRLRPPDRFQVLTGFRRVAALKLLQREKVLARLHTDLSDDDALMLSLAEAVHSSAVSKDEIGRARTRLESERRLSLAAKDMFDKALASDDGLAPEGVDGQGEEVDADELAGDVTVRLAGINQDLSLLADVIGDLDPERRQALLEQLGYSANLLAWLEGRS